MKFITTQAKLKSRYSFTKTSYHIVLEVEENMDFTPGQFVNVLVAENTWRSYSIVSIEGKEVNLFIDFKPQGPGSLWFQNADIGTETTVILPLGGFVIRESENKKLFIATGTGLAPFIPMIKSLLSKSATPDIVMYYGVRYDEDYLVDEYFTEIERMKFKQIPCITQGKGIVAGAKVDRVTTVLKEAKLDFRKFDTYICGNPEMVTDVSSIVREAGGENIYTEKY